MSVFLVRAGLTAKSGLPEDVIVNDFVFNTEPGVTGGDAGPLLVANVEEFYNTTAAGAANPVNKYIAQQVERTAQACTMDVYDITDHLTPVVGQGFGSPVYTATWTMGGAPGNNAVPGELAICLSLQADVTNVPQEGGGGTTRPAARRRGRIYIGPADTAVAFSVGTKGEARVAAAARTDITQAALALMNHHLDPSPNGFAWSVWSRADGQSRAALTAWVDDAPDIIRKRGVSPTTRTIVTRA